MIKNCQTALLAALGFTAETFREAEKEFFGKMTEAAAGFDCQLLDAAAEVDSAATSAATNARQIADRLLRDAEDFEIGWRDQNALAFSSVRDLQEARLQVEERAKALRKMVVLTKGKEVAARFVQILEDNARARAAARKTQP